MDSLTLADHIMLIIVAAIIGFMGKVFWDWLDVKSTNKGLFMTKASCKAIRTDCGIKEFKKEYTDHRISINQHSSKIDQQLCAIEQKLEQYGNDGKALRQDIGEVKEKISGLIAVMEIYVEGQRGKR